MISPPQVLRGPEEIHEFYRRMDGILRDTARALPLMGTPPGDRVPPAAFLLTPDELGELLKHELDLEVSLVLIASYEGRIREDYRARLNGKSADKVSETLRKRRFKRRKWVRIDELLDVWKDSISTPELSRAIGEFRQVLTTRDWLAHGRVGFPSAGRACTPEEARIAGEALLGEMSI